jgi:hypothetical protein
MSSKAQFLANPQSALKSTGTRIYQGEQQTAKDSLRNVLSAPVIHSKPAEMSPIQGHQ